MVIGSINDFKPSDFSYSKNIMKAIEYIKSHDLLSLENGKHIINGDNVYLNRSSYVCKDIKDCKIEGHNKYLDLQLVLKGTEGMGYVDIRKEGLIATPYDEIKDKTNYKGELDGIINLRSSFFALVFPNDLHMPLIKVNDEVVEKAVIKIKIDF